MKELEIQENMNKSIEATQRNFNTIRTGRANASLLDRISVEYYGAETPIKSLATISTVDSQTISIQPFDISCLQAIEKSISMSDLGITPNNDGKVIRINVPPLTEERRKEFCKLASKYAEEGKVALRNIRRDAVRFEFGFIKYGFAWAFPLKESLNIGLGTFINNGLLENQDINNKVIKSFGFHDSSYKKFYKKLRIWNGLHSINGDKVLVVGDAASLCDPFLAEGIRPSLISSFYAAECIDQFFLGKVDNLNLYTKNINNNWGKSMAWGKRIAQVFYRFPRTGYQLGVKRKTAPQRIAQILSGEMSYEDIAKRVIKRLLTNSGI